VAIDQTPGTKFEVWYGDVIGWGVVIGAIDTAS
jgi:hypothetical protein